MKHSFLGYLGERAQIDEAFNSNPYEITMGKKSAGDVFFTFLDEDEKEFRIQFYTPQGIGKNVRQVFIGQRRGNTYPDAIAKFRNPMRVIATMIEATKQFLLTPIGKGIDGFAINFSKKALDRGVTLLPKIIRQSGLKQKLNVMDLNFSPDPARGYVWVIRKGLEPEAVFNGPKLKGITWDDPDKVGDKPSEQDIRDASLQGDIDDQSDFVNATQPVISTNWKYNDNKKFNTPPNLSYYQGNVKSYTAGEIYPSARSMGQFIGTSNKKGQTEDMLVSNILNKLGLPEVPADLLKQFVADSSDWQKRNINDGQSIVDKIKLPKNASILTTSSSGFTILWDTKFKGDVEGFYIVSHYWIYPGEGYAEAQQQVLSSRNKQVSASAKYKVVNSIAGIQDSIDSSAAYYDIVNSQLQTLYSVTYNPNGLFLDSVGFNRMGQVLFQGEDMGSIRNRQSVLNALSSAERQE